MVNGVNNVNPLREHCIFLLGAGRLCLSGVINLLPEGPRNR